MGKVKTLLTVTIIVLVIVSSTLGYFYAVTSGKLFVTQTELVSTQSTLADTDTQLTTTKGDLASTQQTLTSTETQLSSVQTQLESTQGQLSAALTGEASLQTSLTAAASQVAALQNQLSSSNILADPTYASMEAFLASDKTDQNTYNATTYNCVNFSADVIANASKQNIRCAYVNIDFGNILSGHAIVAFDTTDKGMVYIEPQNDCIVQLKVGNHYDQEEIPPPGYYFVPPSYDDTVTRFVVIW